MSNPRELHAVEVDGEITTTEPEVKRNWMQKLGDWWALRSAGQKVGLVAAAAATIIGGSIGVSKLFGHRDDDDDDYDDDYDEEDEDDELDDEPDDELDDD